MNDYSFILYEQRVFCQEKMIDYSVIALYNTFMKKLGEEIRSRRQSLKLTAKDLAHKLGVDPTYITYIEKHDKIPSPALMDKIENVLGDKMLSTIYLRTKYPEVCKKFERGQKDIASEFIEKAGGFIKNDMTPEERKTARREFRDAKAKLKVLIRKFLAAIQKLEEMEASI
jgi:transcriptional regulator with XRE-family HTH domain